VSFHACQWLGDRFWIGAAGVDVFFVISGVIIWTIGSQSEADPRVFFWRRLTRVAPAYWLVTGVVALIALAAPTLLPRVSLSPRHVLLSLAFIQHTDPKGLVFPVLPPGWSLDYEAVFYGLFTLALLAPARFRLRLILSALAAVTLFGFLDPPAYELGANPMMLQFAAGVWLAQRAARRGPMSPRTGFMLLAAGFALFALQPLTGLRSDLFRPLLWGVPAALIVAGALALEPTFRRWSPRALIVLGNASYAIYLVHYIVVGLTAQAVGEHPGPLFVALAVGLSLAVGLAFHSLVERPLIAGFRALPDLFIAARSTLGVTTIRRSAPP
jgi:exopolysaccharide production protein ExoZ